MNVHRFRGGSTREALQQVREALGADAVILSNRRVADGVEIIAAAEGEMDRLVQSSPAPVDATGSASSAKPVRSPDQTAQAPTVPANGAMRDLVREIRIMRGMLEGELAGLAWGQLLRRDPARVELMRRMLALGFSPPLCRRLADGMPGAMPPSAGERWAQEALRRNLRAVPAGEDIVEKGGVYALVGPTGSGKTTTVAKLAARCTLRHGAASLALLTTDSYRIGAYEQLRIYGKILGVPVYAVKDESDLELTLSDLRSRHLVLIDTVGMSQRDRRIADQVAFLCGEGRAVRRLLLLTGTAQASTLADVVRAYRGPGLDGCILTKLDEAITIGAALDTVIRNRLSVHYLTNGQRVPEDLHLANSLYLVDRAFKPLRGSYEPAMDENEYALLMSGEG